MLFFFFHLLYDHAQLPILNSFDVCIYVYIYLGTSGGVMVSKLD